MADLKSAEKLTILAEVLCGFAQYFDANPGQSLNGSMSVYCHILCCLLSVIHSVLHILSFQQSRYVNCKIIVVVMMMMIIIIINNNSNNNNPRLYHTLRQPSILKASSGELSVIYEA
jgi:hypothetical protein